MATIFWNWDQEKNLNNDLINKITNLILHNNLVFEGNDSSIYKAFINKNFFLCNIINIQKINSFNSNLNLFNQKILLFNRTLNNLDKDTRINNKFNLDKTK